MLNNTQPNDPDRNRPEGHGRLEDLGFPDGFTTQHGDTLDQLVQQRCSMIHVDSEYEIYWGLTPYLGGDDKIINKVKKHVNGRADRGSKDAKDLKRIIENPPEKGTLFLLNSYKKRGNGRDMSLRSAATVLFDDAAGFPTTFETGGLRGKNGARASELMNGSQIHYLESEHGVEDLFVGTHKQEWRWFRQRMEPSPREWLTVKEDQGCKEIDSSGLPSELLRELTYRGNPHDMVWARMNRSTVLARYAEYLEEVDRLKELGRQYRKDHKSVDGKWLFLRCLEVGGVALAQLVLGNMV